MLNSQTENRSSPLIAVWNIPSRFQGEKPFLAGWEGPGLFRRLGGELNSFTFLLRVPVRGTGDK
jgi:hypothetical protein